MVTKAEKRKLDKEIEDVSRKLKVVNLWADAAVERGDNLNFNQLLTISDWTRYAVSLIEKLGGLIE